MTGRRDGSHKHYELVEVHRGVSIGVQVLEQFVHGLLVPSALEETGARVSDAGAAGRPSRAGGEGGVRGAEGWGRGREMEPMLLRSRHAAPGKEPGALGGRDLPRRV